MTRNWKAAAFVLGMTASLPAIASTFRLEGVSVLVNESPVIVLRVGDPAIRTKSFPSALKGVDRPIARTIGRGNRFGLYVGNRLLLRIGPEDARAAGIPVNVLAKSWTENLNRALALPPIQIGSDSIVVGNGKESRVPLRGRLAMAASVESSDESVVRVTRSPGYLNLVGNLAGTTQIAVSAGGLTRLLHVRVVPTAVQFPQYAAAYVTGIPATNSSTRGAVESAVWNQLKTAPSADLKFTVPEVGQIPMGEARTVAVKVHATAPDSIPNAGTMYVTVRNSPRIVEPEAELWYDNIPESIERMGQLFGGKITAKQSIRLLYHHDNDTPGGVLFHSQIVNPSDKPAQVLLIPGDSPTDLNPVQAGVDAADRFFRNWLASSGEIVTIPPRGSLPLALRRLAPRQTVSGLAYIALLDGGPEFITVRSDAKPSFVAEGRWAAALASDNPWRILGPQPIRGDDLASSLISEHVYPVPFRKLEVTYAVGGRHGFVRIGQEPIPSASGDRYLDGNFGVVYTIRAHVENPTSAPADVEMVYEASAGYAGALFAVNGLVVPGPLLKPKGEARILRMRLEPGGTKVFTVQTIPHSGGSYPATLALRPIDVTNFSHNKR